MNTSAQSAGKASLWAWVLGGAAVGLIVSILVFAPARWLADGLLVLTQDRVVLVEPRGTVWSGSAELTLRGGPGSRDAARLPGRLEWGISPGWRDWRLSLNATCCTPQGLDIAIRPGWARWELSVAGHQSHWPAAVLTGLGTPWNTLQLQGNLALKVPALSVSAALDRWTMEGDMQLEALEMSSRLSTLSPLGSYRLQLQGGAQPTLGLTTLRGKLLLSGSGRWTAARLRFEGEGRAEPSFEAELANLLNIIGRRDGARSVITLG